MDASLKKYIALAREKKLTNEEIKSSLQNAGWSEEQVQQAFYKSHDSDFLIPPPPPPPQVAHVGMWVGFLYIIFFISLYVLATSVGWLFHIAIERTTQNQAPSYTLYGAVSQTRSLIASIIVSYPIFLILALVLKKQLLRQPPVRNLRSRKILIYVTLIVTFLIMLGHVIYTITNFLNGTITTTALEHVGVTFLVAGAIFWYFVDEVKYDKKNA
ncbi:MAG: DUF5671 domain-containing protein [Candidatus Levyibacteriota bacterium]